jgi:hypothetical protein
LFPQTVIIVERVFGSNQFLPACPQNASVRRELEPHINEGQTVKRIVETSDSLKPEKSQARVLTVREVEYLEQCLTDERINLVDRVACGCMLFCLYCRSRWSHFRRVYGVILDVSESDGKIAGYLECRTRSHKTNRLAMPLVAPVWGVTSPPWGLSFAS